MKQIINMPQNSEYSIIKEDDKYYIYKDHSVLKTPAGNDVVTSYLDVAERLLRDLIEKGYDYISPESCLSWHFTTVDILAPMGIEKSINNICERFLKESDWTFNLKTKTDDWTEIFGYASERLEKIRCWLEKCTIMQLTAICCIGNAFDSVNLAYAMASLLEQYRDDEQRKKTNEFIDMVCKSNPIGIDYKELLNIMELFRLYYGIHLNQNGAITNTLDFQKKERTYYQLTEEDSLSKGEQKKIKKFFSKKRIIILSSAILLVAVIVVLVIVFISNKQTSDTEPRQAENNTDEIPSYIQTDETAYGSHSREGDYVYIEIKSIIPEIGIYSRGLSTYTHFVCSCKTTDDRTVWLYISCSKYKSVFDKNVSTDKDEAYADEKTFSAPIKIHGEVINTESILEGLSYDTRSSVVIEFGRVEQNFIIP